MLIKKSRIGDLLVQSGKISEENLKKAIEIQKRSDSYKKIGEILIEHGFINEEDLNDSLSKQLNIPVYDLLNRDINFRLLRKAPVNILKRAEAVPIHETAKYVEVAFINPLNIDAQTAIGRYFQNKPIKPVLALSRDIRKIIKQLENREKANEIIEAIKKELKGDLEEDKEGETGTMRLIQYIVRITVEKGGSDIHIEAEEDATVVRSRIDGSLQEILVVEKELFNALASRIKLLSSLNISEKRKPQDGRFSMELGGNHFDFRVSTLPIATGESIVIRILDKRNVMKKLDSVGINPKNLKKLEKALSSPNGIILVTGPTGSGKSTTLYASLNKIKSVEEKIITVEDPVEYQMKLIQQVNVNEAAGLTFAAALRSILRQDPDIIMIGEIRDKETLEIAIKAALTGHLVISTLHTNDAISAIARMVDMGADPFMVGAAVAGVEAQRLVKRICPHCKQKYKPKQALIEPIKHMLPKNYQFYKGAGCDYCNMTGYKGRTLVTEVFLVDDESASMIAKGVDGAEIEAYAKKNGYETMFIDGLIKALKGETTLEEVYKVAKL